MTEPPGDGMVKGLTAILVVGGQQRWGAHWRSEPRRHRKGLMVVLDPATGTCRTVVEYVSPPEVLPPEPDAAIVFKAATVTDGQLYCCTQSELLTYALPSFHRTGYLSLPEFNDVHHVRPRASGNLLVANTGLDTVLELTPDGEVVERWNVLGDEPWGRFSPDRDYRRVLTTKPHASHPNYVFEVGGDIWVTRFEQRDAACLTRPGHRIDIAVERPHDGILHEDRIYFTTVDGRVVVADGTSARVQELFDLNTMTDTDFALGWCRGIAVLDHNLVLVGFSRLRPTRFRENVRWVSQRLGLRDNPGNLPTRVALYDLSRRRLVQEWNLERSGLNALFSIHPLAGDGDAC